MAHRFNSADYMETGKVWLLPPVLQIMVSKIKCQNVPLYSQSVSKEKKKWNKLLVNIKKPNSPHRDNQIAYEKHQTPVSPLS